MNRASCASCISGAAAWAPIGRVNYAQAVAASGIDPVEAPGAERRIAIELDGPRLVTGIESGEAGTT